MRRRHDRSVYPANGRLQSGRNLSGRADAERRLHRLDYGGNSENRLHRPRPILNHAGRTCQTIYRFAYNNVSADAGAALPFQYVEVDWNTEGEPRGPNGTFSSAHFDFHFYMQPQSDVDHTMQCVSTNGRTCDQFETSYDQMRLFQEMPESIYVPAAYRADVGSAIPEMGLHLLDASFDYTLDNVNHTPTMLYGSFDGNLIFAETSVTLLTLQDVVNAPGQTITYPYQQPTAFANEIDWPTSFTITYLPKTGGFQAGFTDFLHHEATPVS